MELETLERALQRMIPQMAKILLKGNNAEVKLRKEDVVVLDTSKHIVKSVRIVR